MNQEDGSGNVRLNERLGALHDSVCQTRGHECEEVDALYAKLESWKKEEEIWREREMDIVAERDRYKDALMRVKGVSSRMGWYTEVDGIVREALSA